MSLLVFLSMFFFSCFSPFPGEDKACSPVGLLFLFHLRGRDTRAASPRLVTLKVDALTHPATPSSLLSPGAEALRHWAAWHHGCTSYSLDLFEALNRFFSLFLPNFSSLDLFPFFFYILFTYLSFLFHFPA